MDKFENLIEVTVTDGNGNPNQSILEKLEAKGKAPHTCCRQGFCGACAVTVMKGQAEHFDDAIGFHREDQVLACISRIKADSDSNDIEVGFN